MWGFGVTLAIYVTAAVSGAHLNPAVSLAFAIFCHRRFPAYTLAPYWVSQLAGAFLAGLVVLGMFATLISRYEGHEGVIRRAPGSQVSAMVFGEYFPNPAIFGVQEDAVALISPWVAALVEGFGTAILLLLIFALSDRRSVSLPTRRFAPFFIGFAAAVLISVVSPLTQAGWNPARDCGPRVVAFLAEWGEVAIPGPSWGFWVYIAGPLAGGAIEAGLFECLLRPGLNAVRAEMGDDSG